MVDLENIENHIRRINPHDWVRLFDFVPMIKTALQSIEMSGESPLTENSHLHVERRIEELAIQVSIEINKLDIAPVFDWVTWKEGAEILNNEKYDYTGLDGVTLCKVLTVILRTDRFNEGYLARHIHNGIMTKILSALQKIVDNN